MSIYDIFFGVQESQTIYRGQNILSKQFFGEKISPFQNLHKSTPR